MPISRADLDASILGASRGQVLFALADPATGAAPTDDAIAAFLNWPALDALMQLGFSAVALAAVDDTDLLAVPDPLVPRLMAVALLQAKRRIRGQLALVNTSSGPDSQSLSDLARQLDREIDDLTADIKARFGLNAISPSITVMTSGRDVGAGGLRPRLDGPPLRHDGFEFA